MNEYKKTIILSFLCLLGLLVLSVILAYWSNFNDPFTKFIKGRFPAAIVGGKMVSIQTWNDFESIASKVNPDATDDTAGNVLINNLKRESLLSSLRITVTPKDLEQELEFIKSDEGEEYDRIINQFFGGDEDLFTELVVVPRVFDKLLRVHYNLSPNINHPAQVEAMGILAKIKAGQEFDAFTSQSDDEHTGQLGGDLGFVKTDEVLPELADKLDKMTMNEVLDEVVVSRLGYHVLSLAGMSDEDGVKSYHLKHILSLSNGYEAWEAEQLEKISVRRLK